MAWTNPVDPVTNTVITVAYAVANFLSQIRHLRAMTGGADPPASNRVVVSSSTSATAWQQVPTDAIADGAVTNAKIGDLSIHGNTKLQANSINGDQRIANSTVTGNSGTSAIGTGVIHPNRLVSDAFDAAQVGAAFASNCFNGTNVGDLFATDAFSATQVAKAFASGSFDVANVADVVADNTIPASKLIDGSGSGVDADTVDGNHASAFALVDRGVPSGAVVFFETLAELTAAGAAWARYTAADGRLLVGAGASASSQTFLEATSYGTGWVPVSGLSASSTAIAASSTASTNIGTGTLNAAFFSHNHPAPTITISGQGAVYLPYSRAGIWGRKT